MKVNDDQKENRLLFQNSTYLKKIDDKKNSQRKLYILSVSKLKEEKKKNASSQNKYDAHKFNFFKPFNFRPFRKVIIRKKRQKILGKYPFLYSLYICKSKSKMIQILRFIQLEWKHFLIFYLTRCFTLHLLIRQIKNYRILLRYRQTLLNALDNPDLINQYLPFSSNLIKNFCKGVCNFVFMFFDGLVVNGFIPKSQKNCIIQDNNRDLVKVIYK